VAFPLRKFRVRITVLRKLFHSDFVEKYAAEPEGWKPCQVFNEGDVFLTSKEAPWAKPEGFSCDWAWADMQKLVYGIARGGQDKFVTCCTDGYRPVFFLLEKIPDRGSESASPAR